MKPNRLFITFAFIGFLFLHSNAQTISGVHIPKDYRGRLDQLLVKIGKDMNIRFVYDSVSLSRYNTSINPNEEKTIGGMLKMFGSAWDLKYKISEDGYIYIARNNQQLEDLIRGNVVSHIQLKQVEQKAKRGQQPILRNFTLTGEIFDQKTGERIPYASVLLSRTRFGTSSDANGRFVLEKVPNDTCSIRIQYIGYRTRTINLQPNPLNPPLRIELEIQSQDIAAVFITGRKDDKALQQYTGEHKMKMAPEALKLLPNVGEKDIMRGFQLMPGVSASNENSSGMYVRGGTPDQNLILYDGFTVYYVDHLHGFYSAFNSNALKDVQLYKGGFDAKYGGRISSVTEITAKDGNKRDWVLGGEISLLSMNAYAEVPIGDNITTLFAFRRSYQGYLYNKISGQNSSLNSGSSSETNVPSFYRGGSSSTPPAYFYDMNAKVTYQPNKKDILSLSFFNGTDYVDNTPQFSFPGGPPGGSSTSGPSISMNNNDYSEYGNIGSSFRWSRKWNPKWFSNALVSYSKFYATRDQTRVVNVVDEDANETTSRSGILENNNLQDFSVKNDWRYSLNQQHTLETGVFGTYYDIHYAYAQTDTSTLLDITNKACLAGIYLQDKIQVGGDLWVITPGIRSTYYESTHKTYWEPRLSSSLRVTPRITLNAATGKFYQFANRVVREDVMSGNSDFWILSDGSNIPVSSSIHYNLGINYDLPNYIFSIEGYYKRNKNISEYTLRFQKSLSSGSQGGGLMGGGSNSELNETFMVGDGYACGLEFLAQKKAGQWNGWVSYTMGQVKTRFPSISSHYFYANQDVTHEFKAVSIYKLGNLDLSATWIFSTGRPYTAPLGAYQIQLADGTEKTFFAVSDRNSFRYPNYHRLDIAATYRFDLFWTTGKSWSISASVFNLYNRKNVSSKQFEVVDHSILESNINYLTITPNLSFLVKF